MRKLNQDLKKNTNCLLFTIIEYALTSDLPRNIINILNTKNSELIKDRLSYPFIRNFTP